jgi:hypothetical protein
MLEYQIVDKRVHVWVVLKYGIPYLIEKYFELITYQERYAIKND